MMNHDELVELARLCAYNSRITTDREVAYVLWQMANEYQAKAGRVDGEALIHSRDEIAMAH
jgi:hypothetical protein